MTNIISQINADKANIKKQLASNPDTLPIIQRYTGTLNPEAICTTQYTRTYDGSDNVFIFGHPDYGIFGTNKFGDTASTLEVYSVTPNNNILKEYFDVENYVDSANSNGTMGTNSYSLANQEYLQSDIIYLNPFVNVTSIDFTDYGDGSVGESQMRLGSLQLGTTIFGGGNTRLEVTNDNGATWEVVNSFPHTFTTPSNLGVKYKITANEAISFDRIFIKIN